MVGLWRAIGMCDLVADWVSVFEVFPWASYYSMHLDVSFCNLFICHLPVSTEPAFVLFCVRTLLKRHRTTVPIGNERFRRSTVHSRSHLAATKSGSGKVAHDEATVRDVPLPPRGVRRRRSRRDTLPLSGVSPVRPVESEEGGGADAQGGGVRHRDRDGRGASARVQRPRGRQPPGLRVVQGVLRRPARGVRGASHRHPPHHRAQGGGVRASRASCQGDRKGCPPRDAGELVGTSARIRKDAGSVGRFLL